MCVCVSGVCIQVEGEMTTTTTRTAVKTRQKGWKTAVMKGKEEEEVEERHVEYGLVLGREREQVKEAPLQN